MIGRAVPQSFNYDEERKFSPSYELTEQKYVSKEPKDDSSKFIPSEDGKSSP